MSDQKTCDCGCMDDAKTVKVPVKEITIPCCGMTLDMNLEGLLPAPQPEKEYEKSIREKDGYLELPGGLFLQWGWFQTGTNGMGDLVFPKPFPNRMLSITASDNSNAGNFSYIVVPGFACPEGVLTTKTRVQVMTSLNGAARQDAVYWIAIGY